MLYFAPRILLALEFLYAFLAPGPQPVSEIRAAAESELVSWRTLQRAKRILRIRSCKIGLRAGWAWMLPPDAPTQARRFWTPWGLNAAQSGVVPPPVPPNLARLQSRNANRAKNEPPLATSAARRGSIALECASRPGGMGVPPVRWAPPLQLSWAKMRTTRQQGANP